MKPSPPHRRQRLTWRVQRLQELIRLGVTDRREQAERLGVSLAQIDRVRRAIREPRTPVPGGKTKRKTPTPSHAQTDTRIDVQLGVRLPRPLIERLKSYSEKKGLSVTLVTAAALDHWLNSKGWPGSSG